MEPKDIELFWTASLEEIKLGYVEYADGYCCIICEEKFEKGRIYDVDTMLYEAERAAQLHLQQKHGSMVEYLLGMNNSFTGLSEVQHEVLSLLAFGLSDKETAEKLGVAQSTIRNHRFKFREREKQARLFLALMDLISEGTLRGINKLDKTEIKDAHKTATTIDDRYNITSKEKEDVLKTYFDEQGALKNYPAKEKKKIIVLCEIAKLFSPGKKYSEKEVNRMIGRVFEDHATIRRALIEYGYMDRSNDCKSYWVKE